MSEYYACIIGVPKYNDNEISALPFCSNDCKALKQTFIRHLNVKEENIYCLGIKQDEQVDNVSILRQIKKISRTAKRDDTILFYFSGHGDTYNEEGYLITFNAEADLIPDTCIPIDRIKNELNESQAKRKLLIIDSCYAGMHTGKGISDAMSKDFEKQLFKDITEGWIVFASCKGDQLSHSLEDGSMSVFTFYLNEAFKGNAIKDSNGNTTLPFNDVYTYVTAQVQKWAINNNKFQTPNYEAKIAGRLLFEIISPDINDELRLATELTEQLVGQKKNLLGIELIYSYLAPEQEIYHTYNFITNQAEEKRSKLTGIERIELKNKKLSMFIEKISVYLIDEIEPSEIESQENDVFLFPYGKLFKICAGNDKFGFRLVLEHESFSEKVNRILKSIDRQEEFKWSSIEYMYKGNFNFDLIKKIVLEKKYCITGYNPKNQILTINLSSDEIKADLNIEFSNLEDTAAIRFFQKDTLQKEFYETLPLSELISIFENTLN